MSAKLPPVKNGVRQEPPSPSYRAGMGGGGVTDHGALTGLADDDHPQYALAANFSDRTYAFFVAE